MKRKDRLGIVLVASLVAAIVLGGAVPANAYNVTGAKWPNGNIKAMISSTYGSSTANAWIAAISSWNSKTDVNITRPAGNQTLRLYDVDDGSVSWDGLTVWSPAKGTLQVADARVNYHFTKNYSAEKTQGVAAHEIGHAIGLDHRSGCYLMNPNTPDRCNISAPTQDEVNGANALY